MFCLFDWFFFPISCLNLFSDLNSYLVMQELQIMKDMWRYLVWWFVKEQGKINYNVCNMKTQSQPQAVFALCHHLTLSSLMLRTCQQPCTDWSAFSLLMDKQAFAEFIFHWSVFKNCTPPNDIFMKQGNEWKHITLDEENKVSILWISLNIIKNTGLIFWLYFSWFGTVL